MNREVLDSWLERAILALALFLLVALPLTFGGRPQPATGVFLDALLQEPFLIAQWITVLLCGLWLARIWVNPKTRLLFPPICWAVLAFAAYAIVRWLTSDIEYVARQEVIRILVYALLFIIMVNNLHRQETTQIIAVTLIVLASLLAALAIFQFAAGSDRVWHLTKSYHHRGTGTFISPNHLGGFLEMILPLALGFTLLGRFKPTTKVFLGYTSVVIIAGIAVTMSRGAWIASALSVFAFFVVLIFHRPYRLISIVALAVFVLGGAFLMPAGTAFKDRFAQIYSTGKINDDARFSLWMPAIQIWRQNPAWGAGPGHFDYRFPAYRPEHIQARPDRVHNDFLNTLTDWGTAGGMLAAVGWAILAWGAVKTWGRVRKTPRDIGGTPNSGKTAFVIGAAMGLLALFLHSAVDFNLHIPANACLAVALAALLASHMRFATDNFWFSAGVPLKLTLSVFLGAGILFLGFQSWQRSREAVWLARAQVAPDHLPKREEALRRAFEIEPRNSNTARLIGEQLKYASAQGTPDYQKLAEEALVWLDRCMKLNPWDISAPLDYGWCLDWLDRGTESAPYFKKAQVLDPNSYFTMAGVGLHYVQQGQFAAARYYFERSLRLEPDHNPVANSYLQVVNTRLAEDAAKNREKPQKNAISTTF